MTDDLIKHVRDWLDADGQNWGDHEKGIAAMFDRIQAQAAEIADLRSDLDGARHENTAVWSMIENKDAALRSALLFIEGGCLSQYANQDFDVRHVISQALGD